MDFFSKSRLTPEVMDDAVDPLQGQRHWKWCVPEQPRNSS
jgi:hypothetical protein